MHLAGQIFFTLLLAVSLLSMAVSLMVGWFGRRDLAASSTSPVVDRRNKSLLRLSLAQRAFILLQLPSRLLAWPVGPRVFTLTSASNPGAAIRVVRMNNRQIAAREQLHPFDKRAAVYTAALVGVVIVATQADLAPRPLLAIVAGLALAATALRHVSYLIGSLPDRLRGSLNNPYTTFLFIALSDAGVLTGTVALLFFSRSHLTPHGVHEAALALFALQPLYAVVQQPPVQALLAVIGLVFYGAVIKSLLSSSDFRRKDNDCGNIAGACALVGDYVAATQWLRRVQEASDGSLATRAAVAIGEGNYGPALDAFRGLKRRRGETQDDHEAFLWLFEVSCELPLDTDQRLAFARYAMGAGASDVTLETMLTGLVVLALVPLEAIVQTFVGLCDAHCYPLTSSLLQAGSGRYGEARETLDAATPGSEVEEYSRLTDLVSYELADPSISSTAKRAFLETWANDDVRGWPIVVELVHTMRTEVERRFALSRLLLLLDPVLVYERGDELYEQILALVTEAGTYEETQALLRIQTAISEADWQLATSNR